MAQGRQRPLGFGDFLTDAGLFAMVDMVVVEALFDGAQHVGGFEHGFGGAEVDRLRRVVNRFGIAVDGNERRAFEEIGGKSDIGGRRDQGPDFLRAERHPLVQPRMQRRI